MKKRFTACMIGATLLTAALTGCSGGKTADAPASSADQTTTAEAASTDATSVGVPSETRERRALQHSGKQIHGRKPGYTGKRYSG